MGPELPLSSLSRSLNHQAVPPAGHRPAYTVHDTRAQLLLLLLSCFPLRPPRSAASYLMMPTPPWGVEPRSVPGGSPSNLQASSIEATLRLSDQHRCCNMLCDEERNKKRNILFLKLGPDDQTKKKKKERQFKDYLKSESAAHFTILFLFSAFTHTDTHTVPGCTAKEHTHA